VTAPTRSIESGVVSAPDIPVPSATPLSAARDGTKSTTPLCPRPAGNHFRHRPKHRQSGFREPRPGYVDLWPRVRRCGPLVSSLGCCFGPVVPGLFPRHKSYRLTRARVTKISDGIGGAVGLGKLGLQTSVSDG
jgi:hypothetical protein